MLHSKGLQRLAAGLRGASVTAVAPRLGPLQQGDFRLATVAAQGVHLCQVWIVDP